MSLYTLDGNTRQLLKLDRFDDPSFSVKSFIEQLSGQEQHLDDGKRLDPKPYIRTLESASGELQRLYDIALNQEEIAGSAASDLNENRNQDIVEVNATVHECVQEVKALDEIAAEIQQSNGSLNQNLKAMAEQHAQISEYKRLVNAYLAFVNKRPPTELNRLWASDRRKGALFVSRLQKLAMLIGGEAEIQQKIDKHAESLENQLVSEFQEKYQNFDLVGMRECAEVSTGFNGGGAIIQAYINQHPFFMNLNQLQIDEAKQDSDSLWEELGNPTRGSSELEAIFDELFTEITSEITKETEIITKVFSNPAKVLSMFIQRTFVQKVQNIISEYMEEATTRSPTLIQLRVLSSCYTRINFMNNFLQNLWSKNNSGLNESERNELGHVLDQNFADVVLPYLQDYFDMELVSLDEIVRANLQNGRNGVKGVNAKDGSIANIKRAYQYLTSDTETATSPDLRNDNNEVSSPSSLTPSTSISSKLHENGPTGSPDLNGSNNTSDDMPMLNGIQITLSSFAEAIAREQNLRATSDFVHDATEMFNLLMIQIGGRCISSVIDSANETASKIDTRNPIKWEYLHSVRVSSHCLRLVSSFVRTALFAMVQYTTDNGQTEMAEALNTYVSNVQNSCKALIEKTVRLMHNRFLNFYSRSSKRDFAESPYPEHFIHPEIFNDLKSLFDHARQSLSTPNLTKLMKAVAKNFCVDLHAQMAKYTISVEGGNIMGNDILKFERLMVNDWGCGNEIAEEFALLRSIVRLYTANHTLLPSLLRDSHLSKLAPGQVRGYLIQRSDFNPKTLNIMFLNNNARYLYNY